jgi:hypothetical protein
MRQTHTDKKKAELIKENKCFYCKIKGHHTHDCRKKAVDCIRNSSRPANNCTSSSSGSTATVTAMTPTELVKYIQDNMGAFDEDAKISIIESLMPSGFVQGPN